MIDPMRTYMIGNKKSPLVRAALVALLSICLAGFLFAGVPLVNAQSEETTRNFWENPAIMIFLFGCVGAVAPEIVRWYQLGQKGEEITVPARFIAVSIVFAILGGLIAWVFEARTPQAAFYNGVSFPSILKTYAGETIPETTISNPKKANKNHKKQEITFRQYLGALSIKRSKNTRYNKQKK